MCLVDSARRVAATIQVDALDHTSAVIVTTSASMIRPFVTGRTWYRRRARCRRGQDVAVRPSVSLLHFAVMMVGQSRIQVSSSSSFNFFTNAQNTLDTFLRSFPVVGEEANSLRTC